MNATARLKLAPALAPSDLSRTFSTAMKNRGVKRRHTASRADATAPAKRPPPVSSALVDAFIESALPGGHRCLGQPFVLRNLRWMTRGFIAATYAYRSDGRTRLDRDHLVQHLAGNIIVCPQWPSNVDCIEIDIDAKDDAARETLDDRLFEVRRALDVRSFRAHKPHGPKCTPRLCSCPFEHQPPPLGITWQTSRNGGLRYRIALDGLHSAAELRERTLELFAREGIEVKPGRVEIFPAAGAGTARLPLGSECRLDEGEQPDGMFFWPPFPSAGDAVSDGISPRGYKLRRHHGWPQLIRDVPELVHRWSDTVARKRVPLEQVFGPKKATSGPCSALHVKKSGATGRPVAGAAPKAPAMSAAGEMAAFGVWKRAPGGVSADAPSAWAVRMQNLETSGAPAGGRHEACRDLVFSWRITSGLPSRLVLLRLDDWLQNAPHSSKDFTGPRADEEKRKVLKGARSYLTRLDRDAQKGTLRPGSPPTTVVPGTPTAPLLSSRKERNTFGATWREALLRTLNPADAAALAGEPDTRLRRALGVLLALIRRLQAADPNAVELAVPRCLLRTIMGGGARKFFNVAGQQVTPYIALAERALALGVLGPVRQEYSWSDRRARTYAMPAGTLAAPSFSKVDDTYDEAQGQAG